MKPRQWDEQEVREFFLRHVWTMIRYWEKVDLRSPLSKESEVHQRLSGLAHSILTTLDGCSSALPKFVVAPDPHENDRNYNVKQGQNWYPGAAKDWTSWEENIVDISGVLHEELYKYKD